MSVDDHPRRSGHVETVDRGRGRLRERRRVRGARRHGVPARRRRTRAYVAERAGVVLDVDLATGDADRPCSTSPTRRPPTASGACSASPSPPTARHLYVSYTDLDGDTRIDEYAIDADGSLDEGSRTDRVRPRPAVRQPQRRPPGLRPRRLLYIGLGDGGGGRRPARPARTPSSCSARSCASTPTASTAAPTACPTTTPSSTSREPGPRSGSRACATRGASRSTGRRRPLDRRRRPERGRGGRPAAGRRRRPRCRAGRQPRLERHGGRPALRGRDRARRPHAAGLRLPPRRRRLLGDRRLRLPGPASPSCSAPTCSPTTAPAISAPWPPSTARSSTTPPSPTASTPPSPSPRTPPASSTSSPSPARS